MRYFLGVDMGSSSIKATLVDEQACVLKNIKVPVEILTTNEGYYEINPISTWWNGFKKICDELKNEFDIKNIDSLCVSSLCGSFVPVDKDFNPVHNAILYGVDTRSKKQVKFLNEKYGEEYLTEHFGGPFTTHSSIPKILWLKDNLPDVYEKSIYFVESNNFITSRLTNLVCWDYPTAVGAKIIDLISLKAPKDMMEEMGLDVEKIPKFAQPTEILGKITSESAKEFGLSPDTNVYVGACDINAEAMAIGSVHPGDMMVVYGTTICSLLTLEKYSVLKGFTPGMSVLNDTYRLGTASSSGARFIKWMDNLLKEEFEIVSNELPTGIIMLPYLDGVRAPFDNPNAKPVFFGMTHNTELKDFYAATREAIGYEVGMIMNMLSSVHSVPDTINCTGGLTNIRELMQIISNITGKKERLFNTIDASYGDALISLLSKYSLEEIDMLDEVRKNRQPNDIIEPEKNKHALYQPLSDKYNQLYSRLEDLF